MTFFTVTHRSSVGLHNEYASHKKKRKEKGISPPFSLRLTFEERAKLEKEAGSKPLGAYIRSKLFNTLSFRLQVFLMPVNSH